MNFNKLVNELNDTFHIDKIVKYQKENMTESIFKPAIHAQADQIQENITEIHKLYETEIKYFSNKLNDTNIIKLKYSDRDGYYLTVTNTKAKLLQNKLTDTDKSIYTFKARTKSEKSIISDKTKEYSNKLIVYEAKCKSLMKKLFQETIQSISEKYTLTMRKIAHFIAKLDLIKTYSKISKKYGYCRPIIKSQQQQSQLNVSSDGSISAGGTTIGKFRLVNFQDNENKLVPVGGNCFLMPEEDIEPATAENLIVKQGYQEASNVKMVDELVDMIMVTRLYEANMKLLSAQSEASKSIMGVAMG